MFKCIKIISHQFRQIIATIVEVSFGHTVEEKLEVALQNFYWIDLLKHLDAMSKLVGAGEYITRSPLHILKKI